MEKETHLWDLKRACFVEERMPNQSALRWLYERPMGRLLGQMIFTRHLFSKLAGWWFNTTWSTRNIENFSQIYGIDMGEFESTSYPTFNHFFARKFKREVRCFTDEVGCMPAFAEARLLGWKSLPVGGNLPVKGQELTPAVLLNKKDIARRFEGGPVIVARLAPQDYHRFHFADDGVVLERYEIEGGYHSVNPIALDRKENIYCVNHRQVTIQQSRNFGSLAYVDVGAMMVGKIVRTGTENGEVRRGMERGYFLYGGSTIILLGEPDIWRPIPVLLENTTRNIETKVLLGSTIAVQN